MWALAASMSRRFCAGDALAGDASAFATTCLSDDCFAGDTSAFATTGLGNDCLAVDTCPSNAFLCVPHGARLGFALPDGEECW